MRRHRLNFAHDPYWLSTRARFVPLIVRLCHHCDEHFTRLCCYFIFCSIFLLSLQHHYCLLQHPLYCLGSKLQHCYLQWLYMPLFFMWLVFLRFCSAKLVANDYATLVESSSIYHYYFAVLVQCTGTNCVLDGFGVHILCHASLYILRFFTAQMHTIFST